MTNNNFQLIKKETIDAVEARIRQFSERGELHYPKNYSPQNALKAAWLIIQELKGAKRDGYRPALEICSRASVANALLDMVVLGLNPAKKQCYFIVYGHSLACQISYFGTLARLRRMRGDIGEVYAETIHEGDEVTISITNGKKAIDSHKQKFGAADRPIIGAYCVIHDKDGNPLRSEVMTIEQIKQAWKQSKARPFLDNGELNPEGPHFKFQSEMAKKTVINRAIKPIVNSSDDNDLEKTALAAMGEARTDSELADEIASDANGEIIDIEPETGAAAIPGPEDPGPAQDTEDLSVNYKRQLEKMESLDPEAYKKAIDISCVDPNKELNEVAFSAVMREFNRFVDDPQAETEKAPENGNGGPVQRDF